MSSKIKRRLRKTNQSLLTQTPFLNTSEKSVSLSSTKKRDSKFSSVNDFESETVSSSSPLKVSKKSEKKVRRKKIRCTQDFNQLSSLSSSLTEDSGSSTKIEIKRTKKAKLAKGIYLLPKIDNVVEDSVPNKLPNDALNTETIFRRKSRRKISGKSNNEEKDNDSDDVNSKVKQFKKEKKSRNIKSEVTLTSHNNSLVYRNTLDSEIQLCDVEMKNDSLDNETIDKDVCTNEYQSEMSGDQKYSEGSSDGDNTRIKPKKILRKKNKSDITKSKDKCAKTNMNNCNLSNKEIDINNTSLNKSSIKLLNQTSPYQGQKCVNRLSAKQTITNDIQQSKIVDDSFMTLSSNDNNMETYDHEQLILIEKKSDDSNLNSLGNTFNNTIDSQEGLMKNMKEKKNKISIRRKSLASDLNISPIKSKSRRKQSIDTFHFMANEYNDKSLSGSDLFDNTSIAEEINKRNQEIYQSEKHTNSKRDLSNSRKKEVRKSVRFLSPKEKCNIRRNTFDLEESTFDLTVLKSAEKNLKLNDVSPKHRKKSSIYNKTSPSFCLSQNISTKSDGTFEVDKSHVLNQSKVQNDVTFETPVKGNTTRNEISDVAVPKKREILKSRSTIEVYCPRGGRSPSEMKKDIQKGTSVDHVDSENISQINSKHKASSEDSNTRIRIESFQVDKNISLNYKKTVIDLITPETSPVPKSVHKNSSVICLEESSNKKVKKGPSVIKLNRQSTYTKTPENPKNELKALTPLRLNSTAINIKDGIQNKSLHDQNYDSPLGFDISNVTNIDTSKVNKRKRWNKSRASVSFLDLTNIEDISAPWNEVLNKTDSSKCVSEKDLSKNEAICQSPILNSTMSTRMSIGKTFPSNTSTPFSSSKNVLLRQAIIRNNKQNELVNKSKNLSEVVEKPVTKPKRKKMPNFALIHQRAYDKMENLKEMSERKAIRAKLLLSGYKPTDQNSLRSSSKSKKFLQFSPPKTKIVPLTASTSENWKNAENSNKSNILVTKIKNISPSTSNIKVVNKENKVTPLEKKKLIKSSQIPRPKVQNNVIAEKKGFTRYGFKVEPNSVKPATKEEQMKAVSMKTKIIKNTLEERRNVIKGVRSNRRFELLMRMRNQ